jgi:hypothetical protein
MSIQDWAYNDVSKVWTFLEAPAEVRQAKSGYWVATYDGLELVALADPQIAMGVVEAHHLRITAL